MERIIEIEETRINKIRGYMANSTRDCGSGTCELQQLCVRNSTLSINDGEVAELVNTYFDDVNETFYK